MRLRTRLLALSISTVALIVTVLFALHLDTLTRNWLDTVIEHSDSAGKRIRREIVVHISDDTSTEPRATVDQTKKAWTRIVAEDKSLSDYLVEEAADPAGSIAEINIVGEDGRVVASSIPLRVGQDAPHRATLTSVRESGFIGRLSAITESKTDYETRHTLSMLDVPEQKRPVFEIQLLVSPILLWDKVKPELVSAAFVSLLALFAAAGLAVISSHLALRPVRRIGKAIDTLATGKPLGLSLPQTQDREDREVAAIEYKLSLLGEQMQGARRDADQMRTAIGSLTRGVAHEIKNPLNAISLRLETLRMRIAGDVPEAEADIDLVSNEVHRLDRVVRTFLDLNRPMELEIVKFDAGELTASIVEMMRPAASQANVEMTLTKPGRQFVVEADRGLVEQGLMNLINNAIQAIAATGMAGLIRTNVSLEDRNCEIAVTDNGPGMPASVQERIFEPNFTTKATGSGIGLAVTRRTMELHGGTIRVNSSPGEGTTMVLSFPAAARSHV